MAHAPDIEGEVAELASALVRNRCVNDWQEGSGHEARNAATVAGFLEGSGVDVEVVETAPGRANIAARLEGHDPSGPRLVLLAPLDVWPVDEAAWSFDPFAGDVVDGVLRGRGALHALGPAAAMAVAVRRLAATGFHPRGSLTLLGVADSHHRSALGTAWLHEHRPDLVAADWVVLAPGGPPVPGPSGLRAPVLVADLGTHWLRLHHRGRAVHPTQPIDPPLLWLAAASITALERFDAPGQAHEWLESFVERSGWAPVLDGLLDPERMDDVIAGLPFDLHHHVRAVTRPTIHVTGVGGGAAGGGGGGGPMLPAEVTVDVNVRTLPGQDDEFARRLVADVLAAAGVEPPPVIELLWHVPPSTSPYPSPLWDVLERVVGRAYPDAGLVPVLPPERSDAAFFRAAGAVAYEFGLFSPKMALPLWSRAYGPDEYLDLASLGLLATTWDALAREALG